MSLRKSAGCSGLIALAVMAASACSPDCKEVAIEKVGWGSRYEDRFVEKDTVVNVTYEVDTLVAYTLVEHRTEAIYQTNRRGENTGCTQRHFIKIRNDNASYANSFAVRLQGVQYKPSTKRLEKFDRTTNYVTIAPGKDTTFVVEHSAWRHKKTNNERNVIITILQKPLHVVLQTRQIKHVKQLERRRIDYLTVYNDTVNDCECNIDTLREHYATIKELFERMKEEHLIVTE